MKTINERMQDIINVLDSNKAENCKQINMEGNDYFVEGVVICTALNTRHTSALLVYLQKTIKTNETFLHVDNSEHWVVVDMCDIIVHIMTKEHRDTFSLDEFFDDFRAS